MRAASAQYRPGTGTYRHVYGVYDAIHVILCQDMIIFCENKGPFSVSLCKRSTLRTIQYGTVYAGHVGKKQSSLKINSRCKLVMSQVYFTFRRGLPLENQTQHPCKLSRYWASPGPMLPASAQNQPSSGT